MKKLTRYGILSAVALILALAICAQQDTSPSLQTMTPVLSASTPALPDKNFNKSLSYSVVRVIDGDTVVLLMDGKETKVRLIGVDTPETVHPSKPVEAYGKEASRFTENLLKGEAVYLDYEAGPSKLDKYGRLLAYLYRAPDGLFINLEIVRQGYGHAYTKFPFKDMEVFRHYERRAREAEKGLWAVEVLPGEPSPVTITPPQQSEKDVTVYITKTGKCYHSGGCGSLSRSRIPISKADAMKQGYRPCKRCNP